MLRFAFLPKPADSSGRYDDAYGCQGNEYFRTYERRGLFWIPTENSTSECIPIDEVDRPSNRRGPLR